MAEPLDPKKLRRHSEQPAEQPASMNKITPHKGGRTETRLVQMTPNTKRMLDEVLRLVSQLEGRKVSFSDWLEHRIEVVWRYLKENSTNGFSMKDDTVPGAVQLNSLPSLPTEQLVMMSDEVKQMTEYVLYELRRRTGESITMSDMWEARIRYWDRWLHDNPDLPPQYMGDIKVRTGKTATLPPLPPVGPTVEERSDGDGR